MARFKIGLILVCLSDIFVPGLGTSCVTGISWQSTVPLPAKIDVFLLLASLLSLWKLFWYAPQFCQSVKKYWLKRLLERSKNYSKHFLKFFSFNQNREVWRIINGYYWYCPTWMLFNSACVSMSISYHSLPRILSKLPSVGAPCQNRKDLPIDLMYTDIVGLRQFRKKVQGGYAKFRWEQ